MRNEPVLLNIKALACYLGVSIDTVKRMEQDGDLPARTSKSYWHRESVDEHLKRKPELPRLINTKQLQVYLGVSYVTLREWIKNGLLPPKVMGTSYWDRKAVEAHLDRLSGLDSKSEAEATPNHSYWLSRLDGEHQSEGAARSPQ
jgi:predicted site-specific integrase-resolvase